VKLINELLTNERREREEQARGGGKRKELSLLSVLD
jgi:hypothetical protein